MTMPRRPGRPTKDRKIIVAIGLTQGELKWIDKKINPSNKDTCSRSAIFRKLIREKMEKGSL